jgi:hypothetical protein
MGGEGWSVRGKEKKMSEGKARMQREDDRGKKIRNLTGLGNRKALARRH